MRWSLRDNTNYMETGVLSALQFAAMNRREMLRNFWRRGTTRSPRAHGEAYAIVIPEKQDDPRRLAALVNLLREHGIEVSRSRDTFRVKEGPTRKARTSFGSSSPTAAMPSTCCSRRSFPRTRRRTSPTTTSAGRCLFPTASR
jgi:hypothetical protein